MSSVWADTGATAWRAIAKTHLLEGRRDPQKPLGSHSRELDKRLSSMLHHFFFQDIPSRREKAVPLGFVMVAVAQARLDAFNQYMADLLVITLLFCLRYCEYTKTNTHSLKAQFCFQDMQFHDTNGVILTDTAANVFLVASAINPFLNNQKNCVPGETTTMEATGLLHGEPVQFCARRYLHLHKNNDPPNTPICNYYILVGATPKSVTRRNIVELLWATAK